MCVRLFVCLAGSWMHGWVCGWLGLFVDGYAEHTHKTWRSSCVVQTIWPLMRVMCVFLLRLQHVFLEAGVYVCRVAFVFPALLHASLSHHECPIVPQHLQVVDEGRGYIGEGDTEEC